MRYLLTRFIVICLFSLQATAQSAAKDAPPGIVTVDSLLEWSEPDRGLAVRIDHLELGGKHRPGSIYLRFMNTGEEPCFAPTGALQRSVWVRCFELYLWDGARWQPCFWASYAMENAGPPPALTKLQPGESSVVVLSARVPRELRSASHFKVRAKLPHYENPMGETLSNVDLYSPSYPITIPPDLALAKRQRLKLPSKITFEGKKDFGLTLLLGSRNSAGGYPELDSLWVLHNNMIRFLEAYSDADVQTRLDPMIGAKFTEDEDVHWHLLLSTLSAMRGSETGKQFLLEQLQGDDYEVIRSAIFGLRQIVYEEPTPAWAADRLLALLADQRPIVIPEGSSLYVEPGEWWFTDEELAQAKTEADPYTLPLHQIALQNDVARTMGHIKYAPAVDRLLQTLEGDEGIDSISALGEIGDGRAIQPLLELLRSEAETATYDKNNGSPQRFRFLVTSLAALQAKEAVPLLAKHLEHPCVVEALRDIGDQSVIPALQNFLIEDPWHRLSPRQRDTTKLTLIVLEDSDVIAKLSEFINNPAVYEYAKSDALRVLAATGDPAAIPVLLDVIRSDPDGSLVSIATWSLQEFPSLSTAEGLVECLKIDYSNRKPWKPAYSSDDFKDDIAKALRHISGQPYGADFEIWDHWLRHHADAYFIYRKDNNRKSNS